MANSISKDINLLLPYSKKPKKQEKKKKNFGKVLFLIILIVALGSVYAMYLFKINELNNDIDKANEYMNNPSNVESFDKSNEYFNSLSAINILNNQLKAEYSIKENTVQLKKEIFDKVYSIQSADVVINSIMYVKKDNSLMLDLSVKNELDVNNTIKKLQYTGVFKIVSYSGYQYSSEKGGFTFRANCILNASESNAKEENTSE